MTRTSFALVMLGIAASMALVLGLVGIYGVVAYAATRRTREVGIRLTLGAQQRELRGMFLRHGLVLTCIGIAIGLGAAAAVARVMTSLLFDVSPVDPLTYVVVALLLMTATLLASYIPHAGSRVSIRPSRCERSERSANHQLPIRSKALSISFIGTKAQHGKAGLKCIDCIRERESCRTTPEARAPWR